MTESLYMMHTRRPFGEKVKRQNSPARQRATVCTGAMFLNE